MSRQLEMNKGCRHDLGVVNGLCVSCNQPTKIKKYYNMKTKRFLKMSYNYEIRESVSEIEKITFEQLKNLSV